MKLVELLGLDEETAKKVIDLIKEAGDGFPCSAGVTSRCMS
jgi:hypothetical protein